VAPLRRDASHRSEQTSQLLFGERALVLAGDDGNGWTRLRCAWDGYEGWCRSSQLRFIDAKTFRRPARMVATHSGSLQLERGAMWLPAGAELTGMKHGQLESGTGSGRFKGKKIRLEHTAPDGPTVVGRALEFLHAPYQWGGRSMAGIDCSGLVQLAFKLCGMAVQRDASEQAGMGREVHFLSETRPGDLAFFDNDEGRVVHVGILCGGEEIVHATDQSGRVVLDRIDGAGIVSVSLKRRTHHLRTIRRLL
jgi:cell wall-associated NlpC family hydrolase